MNNNIKRISTVLALFTLSTLAQAQQARSLSDCRAIEGELARYACYESLEDAGSAAAPAATAPAAGAAAVTPPRPVSNLPVVRRPNTDIADLTGQTAAPAAEAATAGSAAVRQQEEKPGLLRRLLPFGGGDDTAEQQPAAPAATAAATAGTGNEAIDSFGRREQSSAQVKTNKDGKQELVDNVASLKTLGPNILEVTLESGQVWRQMLSKRYPLQVGDSVTIRPTMWGSSYRLTAPRISGFIQVERVD
jgi:hypothetical protein